MEAVVPQHHQLRQLLGRLTERSFTEALGWPDFNVTEYLANLLVEFAHIDSLYRIKDQQGKSVETVVELLYETELLNNNHSHEREREIHRHIGDLTLFIAGLFPEYLSYLKTQKLVYHTDFLVDYMKAGKRSYGIVAALQQGKLRGHPSLFQKLSSNFELCVAGLGFVRKDLERMQNSRYQTGKDILFD